MLQVDDPRLNAMALRAKDMPLTAEQQAALDALDDEVADSVAPTEASVAA
jgi:hypothetical protein